MTLALPRASSGLQNLHLAPHAQPLSVSRECPKHRLANAAEQNTCVRLPAKRRRCRTPDDEEEGVDLEDMVEQLGGAGVVILGVHIERPFL